MPGQHSRRGLAEQLLARVEIRVALISKVLIDGRLRQIAGRGVVDRLDHFVVGAAGIEAAERDRLGEGRRDAGAGQRQDRAGDRVGHGGRDVVADARLADRGRVEDAGLQCLLRAGAQTVERRVDMLLDVGFAVLDQLDGRIAGAEFFGRVGHYAHRLLAHAQGGRPHLVAEIPQPAFVLGRPRAWSQVERAVWVRRSAFRRLGLLGGRPRLPPSLQELHRLLRQSLRVLAVVERASPYRSGCGCRRWGRERRRGLGVGLVRLLLVDLVLVVAGLAGVAGIDILVRPRPIQLVRRDGAAHGEYPAKTYDGSYSPLSAAPWLGGGLG